jgi:hypothetical protein
MYFTKYTTATQEIEKYKLDGNERHFLISGREINDIAIGRYIEISNVGLQMKLAGTT